MRNSISRRGVLQVIGAGIALPASVLALGSIAANRPTPVRWTGACLGAMSQMTLWHKRPSHAKKTIFQLVVEIERLENIFSLYRSDSEISRLNRDGQIQAPSSDLIKVLEQSQIAAQISSGAFDPTVQSLWNAYNLLDNSYPFTKEKLRRTTIDVALSRVDYTAIATRAGSIRLEILGLQVSLNGIAQGYITDKVIEILGNQGFENAVIDLGETRTLGAMPDGSPYTIGLIDPTAPEKIAEDIQLTNAAVSVSGGYGSRFKASNTHHIFNPQTGLSANNMQQVVVIAAKAVDADVLSTAIYVAGEDKARHLLDAYPGSKAILTRNDGSTVRL